MKSALPPVSILLIDASVSFIFQIPCDPAIWEAIGKIGKTIRSPYVLLPAHSVNACLLVSNR